MVKNFRHRNAKNRKSEKEQKNSNDLVSSDITITSEVFEEAYVIIQKVKY